MSLKKLIVESRELGVVVPGNFICLLSPYVSCLWVQNADWSERTCGEGQDGLNQHPRILRPLSDALMPACYLRSDRSISVLCLDCEVTLYHHSWCYILWEGTLVSLSQYHYLCLARLVTLISLCMVYFSLTVEYWIVSIIIILAGAIYSFAEIIRVADCGGCGIWTKWSIWVG